MQNTKLPQNKSLNQNTTKIPQNLNPASSTTNHDAAACRIATSRELGPEDGKN